MSVSLDLYRKMFLIRKAEEKIIEEYGKDEMKTPMHMSMGEEAIAAGVCAALGNNAQIWGTYRSHAIYLARTGDVNGFFAELYGKETGPSGGKAGSMHLADPDKGVMMTSAVVATNISPALGAAFANRALNNGKVAVAFFGDGAVDEGVFWESINLACLWKLPVLFVHEDNGLAIHTSTKLRHSYEKIADIVKGFGCYVLQYEDTDVEKIFELINLAAERLRSGPVFLSLKYYRYLEHVGVNEDFRAGYRTREEFMEWLKRDPIDKQRTTLISAGLEIEVEKIEKTVIRQIEQAVASAKAAPFPEPEALYARVYDGE